MGGMYRKIAQVGKQGKLNQPKAQIAIEVRIGSMRSSMFRFALLTVACFVAGCSESDTGGRPATLQKNDRINGGWINIGELNGYMDNRAACDEIAVILNRHADEFSGQLENEFRCL